MSVCLCVCVSVCIDVCLCVHVVSCVTNYDCSHVDDVSLFICVGELLLRAALPVATFPRLILLDWMHVVLHFRLFVLVSLCLLTYCHIVLSSELTGVFAFVCCLAMVCSLACSDVLSRWLRGYLGAALRCAAKRCSCACACAGFYCPASGVRVPEACPIDACAAFSRARVPPRFTCDVHVEGGCQ